MTEALRFLALTISYAGVSGYGLFLMKSAAAPVSVRFAIGIVFYGAGFLVWIGILRNFPLTIAFPAAAGTLIVSTQIFGIWLDEPLSTTKAGALVLIILGTLLLSVEARQ